MRGMAQYITEACLLLLKKQSLTGIQLMIPLTLVISNPCCLAEFLYSSGSVMKKSRVHTV